MTASTSSATLSSVLTQIPTLLKTAWHFMLRIFNAIIAVPKYILRKIADFILDKLPYFVVSFLILLLVIVFFWRSIFISIHAGEAGVLYERFGIGTEIDYVYPEGFHIVNPFNVMHIYDVRVQVIMHDFTVLTQTGLPIELKIAVRFQPKYDLVAVLHQEVGPDYPEKIILPQIESVLRRNIGQYTPEDIYTNKEGVLSKIITLALEEVGRKYVMVDEIIIRTVKLPDSVEQSIEDKLVQEQRAKMYDFLLEKEKKRPSGNRSKRLVFGIIRRLSRKRCHQNYCAGKGYRPRKKLPLLKMRKWW